MKPIPMKKWGRDHWSTFAYLMSCVTTKRGEIDRRKMRCHRKLHPGLANEASWMGGRFPATRLRNGREVAPAKSHDDWSCLEDIEAAGLLRWDGTGMLPIVTALPAAWPLAKWIWRTEKAGGRWSEVNIEEALRDFPEGPSPHTTAAQLHAALEQRAEQ